MIIDYILLKVTDLGPFGISLCDFICIIDYEISSLSL